jgi:hypothetical protein
MRRWLAVLGLIASVLLFAWWFQSVFRWPLPVNSPGLQRFEFGAPDGTELRVQAGQLEFPKHGSYWVSTPTKFHLEATAVIVLFVVAVIACGCHLRPPRAP